ncbi:hypothetical protein J1605_003903 [Eschrichtius robustus]|uniref:Uncharacterized protein n=1 Tax=Eschrichtius robustus TaxID=9764 RepID=A0AB34HPY2_ESCRO|nr:hypothetical protein J1605_003903 [Eschrichtius robustus]
MRTRSAGDERVRMLQAPPRVGILPFSLRGGGLRLVRTRRESASVRPLWLPRPRSLGFSPFVPWRLSAPIRSAANPRPPGAGLGRGRSPALASAPPAPGPPPMGPG